MSYVIKIKGDGPANYWCGDIDDFVLRRDQATKFDSKAQADEELRRVMVVEELEEEPA